MSITLVMLAVAVTAMAQNGLKISELLYRPRSGGAEYVELYNHSAVEVDLGNYEVVRVLHDTLATHYPLPAQAVAPHSYVVLTKDAAAVAADYHVESLNSLVECRLPTYPNDGGSVVLMRADGALAERFDYTPQMHSPMLHDAAGVALERRSFDRDAGDASNWFSASSTSGYGTPGAANSQSDEWLVPAAAFTLSADVVSPDGDGYQDLLEVSYSMDRADLMADIAVFDLAGHRVAQLASAALLGSHGVVVWDAAAAVQGRYVLLVSVYDIGGTRQTIRRTVAVLRP